MKQRFTARPSPTASVVAAVVGVGMLIFGIVIISQAKTVPGPAAVFLVLWVVVVIGIIIYHVANATRRGGVPTEIIEGEDNGSGPDSTAERLQELENLRSRKLISDAEYETKRQKILSEL